MHQEAQTGRFSRLTHAYGAVGGTLSERTELPEHVSSPEQESDNLRAHFLRRCGKLPRFTVSLLTVAFGC